jgi:hypothetical protein
MKTSAKTQKNKRQGIALILSMVFIVIFSAISIGFLSLSSANTQIADNHRTSNNALNAAFSGLEMMRYWCSRPAIAIPGMTSADARYVEFIVDLQDVLNESEIPFTYNSDTGALSVGSSEAPINIDTTTDSCFYAEAVSAGTNGINIIITGQSRQLTRKIYVQFTYGTQPRSVFDFGVATKGPLSLKGGTLTSVVKSDSDVYIESLDDDKALEVLLNKSEISGNAKIVNPDADIDAWDIKGKVGGLSGQDAIDNTIEVGVAPTEFPYPDAAHFKQYATGGEYTGGTTLTNMILPADMGTSMNPYKFAGGTVINGILYIESPNVIDFTGNVTVNGMIVAEGSFDDNSGVNKLDFTGSVDSLGLPADSQFDAMRQETGTFLLAPGFALSFTGSFGTIGGAIAGNGITFDGNAGGTVNGSVINYSTVKMTVDGSTDIVFNRSTITEIPAGFVQEIVIHYNPESYQENI